ncbi:hypothetical protein [Streptomyces sp. 891-h]|uniref:hypothetical protein n=1 Tax=Streptomyces sp. 891-h TaxID=2720714 RepID=UPI001FA98A43|nr:hypothetical protein [Streptomyces sp. 891-h]UNZ18900.1 hypothetical protein HC362_19475 [Streptomyces sp. 891-h]
MAKATVATAALAVAAVALVRQARQREARDAATYRAGYLDALRDVRRGLLDTHSEPEN